jgi:dephospho-CoA kinase
MTYPVRKIALTGVARSGKDTVGDYLVDKYEFKRFAFADELKRYLHVLFPHIPQTPKPRRALQVFGEGMRKLELPGAEHVWINALASRVDTHIWWHSEVDERGANVVITDLRAPLEYDWCRANGFTIIRVKSQSGNRLARAQAAGDVFEAVDLAHETESHVDSFSVDHEVTNDGTIADLQEQIDAIVNAIGKR